MARRQAPTGAFQIGGRSDWGRLKSMQPLPSPTFVGYVPTLKCALARLRRSAPSTGLDAGQYASPVHRAPFRSRRTSSSGDPTAARRPSEPDIRPATAARRVHFKRGGRSAETSASSVEPLTAKRVGRRAIEIAATTAKPPFVGHAPKLKCTRADGRVCNRGRVHEEGFLIARPTASPGLAAGCADR